MSEARNQRFEIDIDEIERQLRRSVEQPHEPRPDPLAELARIVGQNDPFRGILSTPPSAPAVARAMPANANYPELSVPNAPPPAPIAVEEPRLYAHAPAEHHFHGAHAEDLREAPQHDFDPVAEVYGSPHEALADEDYQPLRRRPSRGKLIAVMAGLAATVSAVALGMSFRKSGGLLSSGAPPVIVADSSPLKVAPENPGGVEVPNQDRQIYTRAPQDGQSRVVDGREQPVDVRATTPATPPVSARNPVSSERNPVSDALGDPRRVRTVAVNPDGTNYGPAVTGSAATPAAMSSQGLIPSGGLPAPVSVQTIAVPARPSAVAPAAPASDRPVAQAAAPASPEPAPAPAAEAPAGRAAVSVLPPARPSGLSAASEKPARVASVAPAEPAPKPAAKPKPAAEAAKPVVAARTEPSAAEKPAAAGARTYSVQIAVRPSEQEARAAWDQAQDKFGAALQSRPASLTSAQVNGKTVHRVRLGPMSKTEADAMCSRLKAKGGNCFVAMN